MTQSSNTCPAWAASRVQSPVLIGNGFLLQGPGDGDAPRLRVSLGLQAWALPPAIAWGLACWVSVTEPPAFGYHPRLPTVSAVNTEQRSHQGGRATACTAPHSLGKYIWSPGILAEKKDPLESEISSQSVNNLSIKTSKRVHVSAAELCGR